jgi:general secretion pathway protein H
MTVTQFVESDAPRLTSAEDKLRPTIVFFSSGESTPFEIEFTIGSDSDLIHSLASDGVSPLEWRQPGSEEEEW